MTKVIVAEQKLNCENKLGKYMEESDYDLLVEEDMDFYAPIQELGRTEPSEQECIFKFRKNRFTADEQLGAYEGLVGAAQPTQNRGLAAGPKGERIGSRNWCTEEQIEIMDHLIKGSGSLFSDDPIAEIREKHRKMKVKPESRGIVWVITKIEADGYEYDNFFDTKIEEILKLPYADRRGAAKHMFETYVSKTTYANQVLSGIAGFYDRYPRIPYGRATSYTEHNFQTYEKCYPFMRKLSNEFSRLLPERYSRQQHFADKLDKRFRVAGEDTPFTTVTVNKNFRTSAHRDAGDLHEGFSNLTVVAKEKDWQGGYLVLPEFRVAINVRPGDLLLINNHEGIHGNTEIIPSDGKTLEEMERISLVCYFREKMLELGSWEYENYRYDFVVDRKNNQSHSNWKPLWNGVSEGMWESQEWFDYLKSKGGSDMLNTYHPNNSKSSLEDFFIL